MTTSEGTPAASRDAALAAARRIGCSPEEFARAELALRARSGDGAPSAGDVFWGLATRAAEDFAAKRDWDGAGVVYHTQARWLFEHEPGHDHRALQRLAHDAAVLDFQKRRHHRRVAIDARRCCEACRPLDGEEFSFARALEAGPLPNPACELGWCTCTWRGIPVKGR